MLLANNNHGLLFLMDGKAVRHNDFFRLRFLLGDAIQGCRNNISTARPARLPPSGTTVSDTTIKNPQEQQF